ncbi:MAG: DUF4386 domain-containing protein [Candidatus Methanoperedenaceae archaeon]|nr:MAG: DUF4386 domain-containing protein [Candidatus Methanoperedenaceae archaeon]
MNPERKISIIAGVLFIIGFAGVITVVLTGPILDNPDYLIKISGNENRIITGALFQLIMAAACAGIGISLYPILKKYNEGLALGAAGFRIIEAVLFFVGTICLLSILTLSREYAKAGAPDAPYFQILGTLLLALRDSAGNLGFMAFSMGALMYYFIFYQSRLIPQWLSGWGFIAAALSLSQSLLVIFGENPFSTIALLLNFPIALQEMVLAVWLIVKGFNPSVIASGQKRKEI